MKNGGYKNFMGARCGMVFGVALVMAIAGVSGSAVAAGSRVKGEYANSRQPYWKIGTLDKQLSGACQRGEFRQRRNAAYSVGFIGPEGRGMTGIANKDWNLIDPRGLAKAGFSYHFYNQGYSNCKVFVARMPAR
ncbi:MAG: hypothetical protein HQ483_07350 [Rhodospirillales bacterium]|nr:hypothetical protein [Rhodospirillales bacterium]